MTQAIHEIFRALSELRVNVKAQATPGGPLLEINNIFDLTASNGVGWTDTVLNRTCYKRELKHTSGVYRCFLEAYLSPSLLPVGSDGKPRYLVVGTLARSNDNLLVPGEKGGMVVELPTQGNHYAAAATATNPAGWIPAPNMQNWTSAARTLPAFAERPFFFVLVVNGNGADAWRAAQTPRPIAITQPLSSPVHHNMRPLDLSERWYLWQQSHQGIHDPWHKHDLDEDFNYGAGADRSRFGIHPEGVFTDKDDMAQRRTLDYMLKAHLCVEGSRPWAVGDFPWKKKGSEAGSGYVVDVGVHWTSKFLNGYAVHPDHSFSPERGSSGYYGIGGEHAECALMALAHHSADLYATDKAIRIGKAMMSHWHRDYYFSASYFSHRGFTRPVVSDIRTSYIAHDREFSIEVMSKLTQWLEEKVAIPPQHAPRRDDEDPPGDGNVVDTWQLGIGAQDLHAYRLHLLKWADDERESLELREKFLHLADLLQNHLLEWQKFYLRAWYAPGEPDRNGVRSQWWRLCKQSNVGNPQEYSSLLTLNPAGDDHNLTAWGQQLVALPYAHLLPPELATRRASLLDAYEAIKRMDSAPDKWAGADGVDWVAFESYWPAARSLEAASRLDPPASLG